MTAASHEKNLLPATGDAEGVLLCRSGTVRWASQAGATLLGFASPEALVGQELADHLFDAGSGLPAPDASYIRCGILAPDVESGFLQVRFVNVDSHELWFVRPDGGCTGKGSVDHTLAATALETARLREESSERMREREEFLAILSHELRTPITVINGYNRLLQLSETGALNETQEHYLAESRKSCKRLDELVDSLLDISSQGAAPGINPARCCLKIAIRDACQALTPLLEDKKIQVEIQVDPLADSATFDRVRIGQVLANLLKNAIHFSAEGGRILVGTRMGSVPRRESVEVFVADEGCGVEADQRDCIFEPYVRLAQGARRAGLGLGLAICKRIVTDHGGAISLEDEPGGGSRFVFSLPRVRFAIDEDEEKREDG